MKKIIDWFKNNLVGWWEFIMILIFTLFLFLFTSCDKEYSNGKNYVYTFSALVYKDEWGIETWGAHQFIIDEKIENVESFKECYVNYLKWSGLDFDGMYNRIYYTDHKNVKIRFERETFQKLTVPEINNCQ